MVNKHFYFLGFMTLFFMISGLKGERIVIDIPQVSVNWQEFVPTVKEKYPCVLVMEYDPIFQTHLIELEKSENRRLISLFSYSPMIVMGKEQIKELFKLEKEEGNIFLISLKESKIVKAGNFTHDILSDAVKTAEFLEKFLLEGEEFSKEWGKFTEEKADPEKIKEYFKIIENGSFKERKIAKNELTKLLPANFKQIYQLAQDEERVELSESCRELIISYRGKVSTITGVPNIQNRNNYRRVIHRAF